MGYEIALRVFIFIFVAVSVYRFLNFVLPYEGDD